MTAKTLQCRRPPSRLYGAVVDVADQVEDFTVRRHARYFLCRADMRRKIRAKVRTSASGKPGRLPRILHRPRSYIIHSNDASAKE